MTERRGVPTTCAYGCGTTEELRPYGPGGAQVCFHCARETPERMAEAERHMGLRMRAAGPLPMLVEEVGYVDGRQVLKPKVKS